MFPFVRQHDSMQCGAACLSMICRHFGLRYSIAKISELCPATTEGVSMHGISETAKRIGFRVVSAKSTIAALQEGPLPAILHWNQNHFVVLYKVKKGKTFYIADPGKGIIKYSRRELESHWISLTSDGQPMGIAMFFEPGENFSGLNPECR